MNLFLPGATAALIWPYWKNMKHRWQRSIPEEKQKHRGFHRFFKVLICGIRGAFLALLLCSSTYANSNQPFTALFSKNFDSRLKALAELEQDLKVVLGNKPEELSGPEKIVLESLDQALKEKRIQFANYTHALILFGELALPTAENLATFLDHAESDEYSKDFLPQARALSFLFQLPGIGTPHRVSGDDLLALARDRKFGSLFRWAFWDNDGGNLDWIRQDLRAAMLQARRRGSLKEDEAFAIARVVFARRPAMLAEWLPFKQGEGSFGFFMAFAQADVFGDPEKFDGMTEGSWPEPLSARDYRSSAYLMIFNLRTAFLSQKRLGLLNPTQFEQQVFEIIAFSRVKQKSSILAANAYSDYTLDRRLFAQKQLTEKDFYLVMAHELGHGVLRLRQYEKYFEGWGAGYLERNKDQITIGELFADLFAILQGKELGMTLQESAEHFRKLSESDMLFSFLAKILGEAHVKARQFEKKLISPTTREEDLVDVLNFMLQKYGEAVQEFKKNGKPLPRWKPFSATVLGMKP
jgi:hypothetical protein